MKPLKNGHFKAICQSRIVVFLGKTIAVFRELINENALFIRQLKLGTGRIFGCPLKDELTGFVKQSFYARISSNILRIGITRNLLLQLR